jgi:hypothetical protein
MPLRDYASTCNRAICPIVLHLPKSLGFSVFSQWTALQENSYGQVKKLVAFFCVRSRSLMDDLTDNCCLFSKRSAEKQHMPSDRLHDSQ